MFGKGPEGGVPNEEMLKHLDKEKNNPAEEVGQSGTEPTHDRRWFLGLLAKGVAGGAAAVVADKLGLLESEAEAKPKNAASVLKLSSDTKATAQTAEEQEAAKEKFLQSNVLEQELRNFSEREDEKKDLRRVRTNEKVINWVVSYGDLGGMKRMFDKVLSDESYRKQIKMYIDQYCRQFNVPFSLAYGVAAHEGHFDMVTKSGVGASGIFQLMPDNANDKRYQANPNASELENNIYGGIKLLREMYNRYHQWSLALMGYCQGNNAFEANLTRRFSKKKIQREKNESWLSFFKNHDVNALTLYSNKIKHGYGFGTQFPFQYPFYVLSMIETGTKIMSGEYTKDNLPPICTNKEVRERFDADSSVLNRSAAKKCAEHEKGSAVFEKCVKKERAALIRKYSR